VVVISIIAIATTLAVSTFRGESPTRKLENASLGFEAYCARVRYAAMENGTDRVVAFDPDARRFVAENPEAAADEEDASAAVIWELPADFELDTELEKADAGEKGTVEVFRFFSDGSATASREFILRFRKLQRRFEVSPLTGLLLVNEEEVED
jgi:type II secretory pathway pseudopilin PulG